MKIVKMIIISFLVGTLLLQIQIDSCTDVIILIRRGDYLYFSSHERWDIDVIGQPEGEKKRKQQNT